MKDCQEWFLRFNDLYQNITSNKAPGLNKYEISLKLTQAEKEIVLGLCNGTLGDQFESTEQVANYLAPLVRQRSLNNQMHDTMDKVYPRIAGDKSYIYRNPSDLMFRTSEFCNITLPSCGTTHVVVVPTTQDEYWRTSRNPFKKQNERKVLRLVYSEYDFVAPAASGSGSGEQAKELSVNKYTELISDYPIESYIVRYIKYPKPIILEDLADGLTIDGEDKACPCLLDEALHDIILNRAVEIARAVWTA